MADHELDQLPDLDSIAGDNLLPWRRLWCPTGGSISMEGYGFSNSNRGFLAEPSEYRNTNCKTLQEWIDEPTGVWVLCGSPGAGKSGAIRQWLNGIKESEPDTAIIAWTSGQLGNNDKFERVTGHPVFREAQANGQPIVIVLDAFDQFRTPGGLPFESLTACLSVVPKDSKIRVLIGCRVRDWNQTAGQSLIEVWGKPKNPRVLEVCPLTRGEVVVSVEARGGILATAFLQEIFEKRLDAAAHWPLTLRSLLDEFSAHQRLPDSIAIMVSRTIDILLRDPSEKVQDIDPAKQEKTRQSVKRLAALFVLGGYQTITCKHDSINALTPHAFCGSPSLAWETTSGTEKFPVTGAIFHELLGSALFTAVRPPTTAEPESVFGFTHQNYAEFLAAEYLKNLEVEQLRGLLMKLGPGGEMVAGPLVETASWLAVMHQDWFSYLLKHTPEILLRSDGAQYSDSQKQRLIQALLVRTDSGNAAVFEEVDLLTPAFSFDGLADCLRPEIGGLMSSQFSRRLAIEITGQCKLSVLEKDLWKVFDLQSDDAHSWATHALERILSKSNLSFESIDQLELALEGKLGLDADDELRGMALRKLTHFHFKPGQIAHFLTLPKNQSFYGSYHFFLEQILPDLVGESGLEALLQLGAVTPSIFHIEWTSENLQRSIITKFSGVKSPTSAMRKGLTGWVLRCAKRNASLPLGKHRNQMVPVEGKDIPIVGRSQRLDWLRIVLETAKPDKSLVFPILRALHLAFPPSAPSLDWVLGELNAASSPELKKAWAEAVCYCVRSEEHRVAHLSLLLTTYDQSPELQSALIPCREGLNIHETYLAQANENDAQMKAWERESTKPPTKRMTRQEWVDHFLREWKQGNDLSWINLWKGCAFDADRQSYKMDGDLISRWEGWGALPPPAQDEFRACARAFLIQRDDHYRLANQWHRTNGSQAAAHAVNLLIDRLDGDHELSSAIREKWVAAWFHEFSNASAEIKQISVRLYQLNPEGCLHVLRERFFEENEADQFCRTLPVLTDCWSEALSIELVGWLKHEGIRPVTFRTAFEFLASQSSSHANSLAGYWLDQLQINPTSISQALLDSICFCSLIFTGGTFFEQAFSLLGDAQNARRILCMGHSSFVIHGHGLSSKLNSLSTEQLGRFTVLMTKAFPELDDGDEAPADEIEPAQLSGEEMESQCELRSRDVTVGMTVSRASSGVMAIFCEAASQEEFEAVSR